MNVRLLFYVIFCFMVLAVPARAARLMVGVARTEINPPKSVPLQGQFHLRLSQGSETPLTANVTALESRDGDKSLDSVLFVSADIISVSRPLREKIEEKVAASDPSIDVKKIVINGTHTHTAPTLNSTGPELPATQDVMNYPESLEFVADRIAAAVVRAWKSRVAGKMAWGLDFAVIGFNRRATYADGRSVMYGKTNDPNFRGMEHTEDHDLGVLFFCDENEKLLSVVVNLACPSQVVEHRLKMNADYWHPVREKLAARFGDEVVVLGWCGAAGDLSPHVQYRKAAIERMNALRRLDPMQEIARKIDRAVDDAWQVARGAWQAEVPMVHRVETLKLPMRLVTRKEYDAALAEVKKIEERKKANPDKSAGELAWMAAGWHGRVVERYTAQQAGQAKEYETTIHVLRLGEVAVCTNQFELFADYGARIKARSPAVMTMLIQLAGPGTYLPTEKAARGGGYSAVIQSTPVGPEGGQKLVGETVRILDEIFK